MNFDAKTLNHSIQSSAMTMGRINQTFGAMRADKGPPLPAVGDVRENLSTKTLVVLLKRIKVADNRQTTLLIDAYRTTGWLVEDLRTGGTYVIRKVELGEETFNEMEALAWAARE